MKVTFFSNFLNHHQLPFCKEMIGLLGDDFRFVVTEKIPQERLELGYENMNDSYDFVIKSYENEEAANRLAKESDVIILGSAPKKYIMLGQKYKNLCFRYNERAFKSYNFFENVKMFILILMNKTLFERNVYMLCASAFTSRDFNIAGAYIDRCYKWGYFPKFEEYDTIKDVINNKESNSILWVGRFIDWKHPELVIEVALRLKKLNKDFKIRMIGSGYLKPNIEKMIIDYNLTDSVTICDSMSPQEVRKYMEKSQIFLFTSDKGEGWGAVLNEAMNSACTVIANSQIGSVPFLIKDNINGFVYFKKEELFNKIIELFENKEKIKEIGENAYYTIFNEWNPKIAATRFVKMSQMILNRKDIHNEYLEGPCSKAKFISNNWFKKESKKHK